MAGGRPTDYSEEVLKKTQEYLDLCVDTVKKVVSGESEKFTAYKEKVTVKIPTIEGLSIYLKCHKDTIFEWDKIHQEFSDLLNVLRATQADRLINNGLSGDYNPMIAKLILHKHGYRESQEIEYSGDSIKIYELVPASKAVNS